MRPPIPFGKYLLLERISVGGMAEVFKSKSFGVEGFEKIIAIKRILPSMAEDAEFVEMFIDEAKIAGQLSHANICQIFELGKIEGAHFIAMEYIWGKDLLQIQNRFRKMGQKPLVTLACFLAVKVCEGLDYAHRRKDPTGRPLQIIHRDVSPQNVLVSYEGEVKLIDFGIAKAATRSSRTQAGVLKGKFGYMSPEQVRGLPLDRRSDIFAIGTLLHEVLSGEKLFANDNDFTTLERVRNAEVEPPSKRNPEVPAALDKIVLKALARDVEARYQWANEMQEELQQFMVKSGAMFSSKQVAAWMKDAFAQELARERAQLEKFKRMGREVPAPPPPSKAQDSIEQPIAEATEIQESAFAKAAAPPARKMVAAAGHGFGDEAPTEIFGHGDDAAPNGALAGISSIDTAIPPPLLIPMRPMPLPLPLPIPPAPTEPTFQSEAETLPVPLPPQPRPERISAPVAVPRSERISAPVDLPAAPSSRISLTATAVPEIRQRRPRPSIGRIAGWIGGGAVVAAGLLGGAYLVGTRVLHQPEAASTAPSQPTTGTLVIATGDSGNSEVFVNGQPKGAIHGGEPLKIEGLAPGDLEVVVKRAGVPDCVQKVAVDTKAAKVVTCRFQARAAQLTLVVANEGATVFVDKQEVSAEAAREPLILSAGTPHEITVKKEGFEPQTLSLTLQPGERRSQKFELSPVEKPEPRPRDPVVVKPKPAAPPPAPAPQPQPQPPEIKPVPSARPAFDDNENGYLVAESKPSAKVVVDGHDTGKSTPISTGSKIPLPPGKHKVTFIVNGQPFSYNIMVEPGQDYFLSKSLPVETGPDP